MPGHAATERPRLAAVLADAKRIEETRRIQSSIACHRNVTHGSALPNRLEREQLPCRATIRSLVKSAARTRVKDVRGNPTSSNATSQGCTGLVEACWFGWRELSPSYGQSAVCYLRLT